MNRLYLKYVQINVQSMMQYKTSFFFTALGQFLFSFNALVGIWAMFQRFPTVAGFTFEEVLFCFAVVLLQFSTAEMVGRGFDNFSATVRNGEFDRILVRPQHEILQVLGSKFDLTRIGRILQALAVFVYAVGQSEISWNFSRILTLCFMMAGGVAVFFGLFVIYAAICFFTLDGLEFMNIFTDGAREFGKYPLGVYGKKALLFSTFVIPYALVQYYPFLYLTGRRTEAYLIVLPLLALLFPIPAFAAFRYGVRKYTSSGS